MLFWYQLPIPTLGDPQPENVRLVEWLVTAGDVVHCGTRIAVIEAPTGRYVLMANGDGVLREQHFPAGAEIDFITPIAVIAADGENIPHRRPYSLAERLGYLVKTLAEPNAPSRSVWHPWSSANDLNSITLQRVGGQ